MSVGIVHYVDMKCFNSFSVFMGFFLYFCEISFSQYFLFSHESVHCDTKVAVNIRWSAYFSVLLYWFFRVVLCYTCQRHIQWLYCMAFP